MAQVTISINSQGTPNLPGPTITQNDTIVFSNTGDVPSASIQFLCANGPVFNNIQGIANGGKSGAQYPQVNEITTDYYIVNDGTLQKTGPFSIMVGINTPTVPAPLSIPISGGAPTANMVMVSIPVGGWVQFHYDVPYTLTWNPSNAFTGPTNGDASNPIYHATAGNQVQEARFSLMQKDQLLGGGSVKIRS
jgi:hypothetical protein